MDKGKLIVIEGATDGLGKSTQADLLYKELSKNNTVITHHFPSYGEEQGKLATNYLNGEYGTMHELSPYFINSLLAVDRAITWKTKLEKEYNKGNIILLDRYTTSSLIYQSALLETEEKKKEFIDFIVDYEYNKLGIKKPDIVIFLTAPYELTKELLNKRETKKDMHEKDEEYLKTVYDNSLFVANYLGFNIVECGDSTNTKFRSIEDIHNDIMNLLKKM